MKNFQILEDGRHIDDENEPPFLSSRIRLPRLIDIAALVVIGAGCALFYNSYVSGGHGLMAEKVIKEQRDLLKSQSLILDQHIAAQKNLNRRLSDEYLDLDLLEERARYLLGYVHAQDILIKDP